jgi:type I restriction enzyme S subunit
MEWKEYPLGDCITLQRGFDITKTEQQSGDVPIVSSSGITSYHNKSMAKGPGVVTGRKGTLGKVFFVRNYYWPHDTTLWIKDFKGCFPKFIFYFLSVMKLENYDVGASNPTLNRNHLHKLKTKFPPLPIQKKIAAVLSAYDDLIENNNRRIAILENMAEEIYREWFVRMRFPGHEKVKFHKGVPEGWQYSPSSSLLKILSGGTPKTEVPGYWNGGIPFFTPKDVDDDFYVLNTEKYITGDGLRSCNSSLYEKNTIFITARGTVGKIALCFRTMAMNQSCYALIPKQNMEAYFFFLALRDSIKYIKGISKSGVFDNIIIDTFNVIPLLMPPADLVKQFNALIKPLFENLGFLMTGKGRLIQSRDLLLSRLIIGKLSVEDLDIHFPPSMLAPDPINEKEADA